MERYIGFAIKSGKCIFGVDDIIKSGRKVKLIVADKELSNNSLTSLKQFANTNKLEIVMVDKLSEIVHKLNVKAIAIKDDNLSKIIKAKSTTK